MPPINLTGLGRVTMLFATGQVTWVITQTIRQGASAAHTLAGMQGVADAVDAVLVADVAPVLSTGSEYRGVEVSDLSTQGLAKVSNVSSVLGTGGATELPIDTALVVTTQTGGTGRDNRGRWFWGSLPSGVLEDGGGAFTAAAASARSGIVLDVFDAILTAVPVEYAPGLYHRNATTHYAANTFTPLGTAFGRTTLAKMSSRRS